MVTWNEQMPLRQVRDQLRQWAEEGTHCPCCAQYVKVYRRALPAATARVMIALYRKNEGRDYLFLPDILDDMKGTPHQGGYGTLGQYWDLLERKPGERDDGSNRVGWWRLTQSGRDFVRGLSTVPKYAHIYNSRVLRWSGPQWSIRDALGKRFDYRELMDGER